MPRLGFRHELASALAALETLRHVRVAGAILDGLKALAINVSTGAGQGRGGGAGVAVSRRPKICYEVFAGSGLEMDVRGVVHGDEIKLEKPLLELDGKRVVVRVEVVEDATDLSPEEQRRAWDEWVARGPQGPIDDEPEWP